MNPEQEQQIGRALFREALDAFIIVQPTDLHIVNVNPAVQRLTGLSRKQLLQLPLWDLFEAEGPCSLEQLTTACQITSPFTAGEGYLIRTQNRRIPVSVAVSRIHIEPEPLALLVIRDISEQKRSEEALHESAELLRLANETAGIGTYDSNLETGLCHYSPELCAMLGLPAGTEPTMEEALAIVHPEDFDRVVATVSQSHEPTSDGLARSEHRIILPDGEIRWMVWSGRTLFRDTPSGRLPVRGIGSCYDITERKRAEEASSHQRMMLQMVMDNIPQGVFWKDRQSRYLGCNQVVAHAFGLEKPEDIIGLDDHQLAGLTAEQANFFIAKDRQVLESNRPELGIIEQATLADGTTIWMETNKIPMHAPQGTSPEQYPPGSSPHAMGERPRESLTGVLGTWQNITLRVQADKTLRESETRKAAILETALDAIITVDQKGHIIEFNPAAEQIFGYRRDEVLGQPIVDFIVPPSLREQCRRGLAHFPGVGVGTILNRRTEMTALRADGTEFPVELAVTGMQVDDTWIFTGYIRDITQRKLAEEALLQSEKKYRDLVETTHDLIWSVDVEGHWTFVNRHGAQRIYGYEPKEMLGRPFMDFLTPEQARKDLEVFAKIKAGEPVFHYETEHLRKDGTQVILSFNAIALHSIDGQLLGTTGTAMDITERKRAEEERRKFEAQMQHTQKLESLGVLSGGIAHDFNNLLTGMLGYADLALRELPYHSPARELIDKVMEGARQAAELTKQMLAYSGKGRFVVKPVNLSDLTRDMARLLQISISKKCAIKYDLMPDLPLIEADIAQLRQVIMNLMINASEAHQSPSENHHEEGRSSERSGIITIRTGIIHCDRVYLAETYLNDNLPEGTYVYLEVADTGCGMSEETRTKIFDPFFTTKFTGRGLGLSAVLGIVRGHRGAIQCSSELGKGTTFTVLFPVSSPSLSAKAPEQQEPETGEWRGSGTVLVVDDDESVRDMACLMLEGMGFTVLTASNGQQGIEVFRSEADKIRLVLLDMTMPLLDGEQTFHEMRQLRKDVPVILSSGYNEQTASSRFGGTGLAGFIQKPYQFEELMTLVRKVVNGSQERP